MMMMMIIIRTLIILYKQTGTIELHFFYLMYSRINKNIDLNINIGTIIAVYLH